MYEIHAGSLILPLPECSDLIRQNRIPISHTLHYFQHLQNGILAVGHPLIFSFIAVGIKYVILSFYSIHSNPEPPNPFIIS